MSQRKYLWRLKRNIFEIIEIFDEFLRNLKDCRVKFIFWIKLLIRILIVVAHWVMQEGGVIQDLDALLIKILDFQNKFRKNLGFFLVEFQIFGVQFCEFVTP